MGNTQRHTTGKGINLIEASITPYRLVSDALSYFTPRIIIVNGETNKMYRLDWDDHVKNIASVKANCFKAFIHFFPQYMHLFDSLFKRALDERNEYENSVLQKIRGL